MLLERPEIDVNIECNGFKPDSALTAAVKSGKIELVELLLSRKEINVNATPMHKLHNENWACALGAAVENDNFDITKLLLAHDGINPNIVYHQREYNFSKGVENHIITVLFVFIIL